MAQQEVSERRKRYDDLPELPEGRPALLLSAIYSGEEKKAYLKFYDPSENVIYHWRDRTGHLPYCYTKTEYEDTINIIVAKETKYKVERTKKKDVIVDKVIDVLKVTAPDPLSIGGTDNSLREKVRCWECYDTETEILTDQGWKSYYQLRDKEVVATCNPQTHKFEWQQIQAKVDYDYNGEMYGLHAKTIDFLVTPNHRICLWDQNNNTRVLLAKEIFDKYSEQQVTVFRSFPSGLCVHKTAIGGFDGERNANAKRFVLSQSSWRCSKIDIPMEEFVEFLGWFIAEGGIGGRGNETYIDLVLSADKDPWQHLRDMIESWGMKVWVGNEEHTHSIKLIFSAKDLAEWIATNCYTGSIHRSYYKKVPAMIKNLPTKYLKIFVRNLFLGDGTIRHGESEQLKTVSEALADDIQEIACKCGYSVTIKQKPRIVDNRGWRYADTYVVTLSSHRTGTNPAEKISKQQYVGKVWCVKVPNGIIYVRRNKKAYWCGNSDIKYHENYLYDNGLIAGLYYIRRGDKIEPHMYQISEKVEFELKSLIWDKIKEEGEAGKEYRQYVTNWANLLNQPIPELRRVAVDIEVETEEGRMPTAREHEKRVSAVGFAGSDGLRKVLVLGDNVVDNGQPLIKEAELCKTEKELLEKAFAIINLYPIILTFNGDDFDLPYLYARSQDPRIDTKEGRAIPKDQVPIVVKKESFIKHGMQAEPVGIRHGVHIDLFRTFQNRSIQIYAFSRKYTEFTLNAICEALLEDSKMEFDGDMSELPMQTLAEYCLKDADLTYRLTSFGDNLLMKLLVVIARIGRLSVDDIARFGVNQWIRGILYYEHRQRNELIPRTDELEEKGTASTAAVIKEKKYRGGEVVEPTPGIHFNVVVLDFASLYPSIIKVHNLSYETINCVHDSCKKNGRIEGTTHWVCQQRKGLSSLLIGSLRDLRVNYYKHLSKDKTLPPQERQLYNVVSQAIKVILNASYGVMGAEIFPLYCLPVADATAAIGRNTIHATINKCKELGIEVVYGDSVLPDTPIAIRRKDGNVDIVPIESLMPKTVSASRYDKFGDLEVLTEKGFTKIKYIYRHKVRKKGYRILSRKGFVECTEDHSLVINGKETKPSNLKVGDKIQLVPFKAGSYVNVNPELAWLFGFFIAEGTCGSYSYDKPRFYTKNSWRIVNADVEKLERAKKIMQESLALPTTIIDIRKSSATYALVPRDNTKLLIDYFKPMCYRGKEKAIPQCILNANHVTKKAFIEGILAGDGHMDVNGLVTIDQIHKTVQAGLVSMLEDLGLEYSLQIRSDKENVCRIRVIRDNADLHIKPADEIKKIEEFEINGYVYDLETENHHFCGGIGNVLLHNTDSLFLKEPAKESIDKVIEWAKDNLGVDLEIDKQYRYVVFSSLKKNYLGVLPDGTVDVKGLTGKKSHTPPFIRNAFYEILGILGKVNSQKDFETARESIKSIIQRDAKNLESHAIPMQDLSFNVMINKSLSSYGKKVNSTKTMDGKEAQVETFKGLPQHIKAAKLLSDRGREIKAGDIISYVKTKAGDGVKPVELAKADEIDTEKYLETMESTLDQVLAALNFDFKSMLGKPRQQSLDELFWSKPPM